MTSGRDSGNWRSSAHRLVSPSMSRLLAALSVFALAAVAVLYYAGIDTYHSLSPQGCRMSWMRPSYLLQNKFDHTWTPLARRYSLWLYREGNLESNEVSRPSRLHGTRVLTEF